MTAALVMVRRVKPGLERSDGVSTPISTVTNASSSQTNRTAAESSVVTKLKATPRLPPRSAELASLKNDDLPALIQIYRSTSNLVDRTSVLWSFVRVHNEEVATMLIDETSSIRGNPARHTASPEDETCLLAHVMVLGALARTSDRAFEFLKQGIDPQYWRQSIPWKSRLGDRVAGVFAGYCLHALELSGRSEASQFVDNLMGSNLSDYQLTARDRSELAAAVMSAGYARDYLATHGQDAGGQLLMQDASIMVMEYINWKKSERAAKWTMWAARIRSPQ